MNNDTNAPITIAINGTLTVARAELKKLIQPMLPVSPQQSIPQPGQSIRLPENGGRLPRLAYTLKETAEILGISQATVYRLLYRGLLRSSLALRSKLIAKSEIERFLKDTSGDF